MRFFLFGLLFGLLILPFCGLLYIRFGYAPVATAASPMPFERKLAHMALNARIDKEAPKTAPIQANGQTFAAGARVYRTQCAVCHGLPGQLESSVPKGMFPKPPQLFKDHGVTDDPPGETYWKVANGIRLTGMPAFRDALTDTEMWQVSLLLADADKLPGDVRSTLQQPLEVR